MNYIKTCTVVSLVAGSMQGFAADALEVAEDAAPQVANKVACNYSLNILYYFLFGDRFFDVRHNTSAPLPIFSLDARTT